jgi:hypothetical protein
MLVQSIIGAVACILSIAIHAVMTVAVIGLAHTLNHALVRHRLLLVGVMIPTVSLLMATHAVEVVVWAWIYLVVGAAPPNTPLIYFSFVNYTTLGYGEILPLPDWQLLGPITAMNGILLFGWSTAVIFEVLRKTVERQAADALGD